MLYVTIRLDGLEDRPKALVDTGAPRCVSPRGTAEMLGLDLPANSDTFMDLMGRRWPLVTETVTLALPDLSEQWDAEVDFVLDDEPQLPFALLGLEGFLNRWAVSFNAYRGYFIIEPVEDFEGRIPPDPFEEFQRRFPDYN
jgi:hypothetical protein